MPVSVPGHPGRRVRPSVQAHALSPLPRVAVLQSPELVQAFNERNILPSAQSVEAFAAFVQNEVAKWKALASKVGIVAE